MNLFLLVFFLIYGSAHLLFCWRVCSAFRPGRAVRILLSLWLLLMVFAPVAVRMLERRGYETQATFVAYAGYLWMSFIFLFFSALLILDAIRLIRHLAHYFIRIPYPLIFRPRPLLLLSFLAAALTTYYGWYEALELKSEHVVIRSSQIPPGAGRLRIALVSDLHVGLIVGEERVRRVTELVRRSGADMVLAAGDILDGHTSGSDGVSAMFASLSPRLGMYAVNGNHEYYAGIENSAKFLKKCGFQILEDRAVEVEPNLLLVGVDDPAASRFGLNRYDDEQKLLSGLSKGRFVLLLKHRPVVNPASNGLFDLQLSGHVHKGQIAPFNLLTWLNFPVRGGRNPLEWGGLLYVSRGSGTWGPPVRFLAPPEVTVVDIIPTSSS